MNFKRYEDFSSIVLKVKLVTKKKKKNPKKLKPTQYPEQIQIKLLSSGLKQNGPSFFKITF